VYVCVCVCVCLCVCVCVCVCAQLPTGRAQRRQPRRDGCGNTPSSAPQLGRRPPDPWVVCVVSVMLALTSNTCESSVPVSFEGMIVVVVSGDGCQKQSNMVASAYLR
jgi:hypothetical protein